MRECIQTARILSKEEKKEMNARRHARCADRIRIFRFQRRPVDLIDGAPRYLTAAEMAISRGSLCRVYVCVFVCVLGVAGR